MVPPKRQSQRLGGNIKTHQRKGSHGIIQIDARCAIGTPTSKLTDGVKGGVLLKIHRGSTTTQAVGTKTPLSELETLQSVLKVLAEKVRRERDEKSGRGNTLFPLCQSPTDRANTESYGIVCSAPLRSLGEAQIEDSKVLPWAYLYLGGLQGKEFPCTQKSIKSNLDSK